MLSSRAEQGLRAAELCNHQDRLHAVDPHEPTANPGGYIKLSSADNTLCGDLINEKFNSIDWSKFDTSSLLTYPQAGGDSSTMECVASFVNDYCRRGLSPVKAEELVLVPGVTSGSDVLSHILFEPDDVILVPGPNYYRFSNDLGDRGQVKLAIVPTFFDDPSGADSPNGSQLRVDEFERVYAEAHARSGGGKVRALMLTNPQNPEGNYHSLDELRPVVEWALERGLFVVLDEIYDLCVYDPHPQRPYRSAVELFESERDRSRLVWMWGLSKNFSLPGLRVSVIYSPNEEVRAAAKRFLMFHHPNVMTQFVVQQILGDRKWVDETYIPENRRRLRERRDFTLRALNAIPKAKYIIPRAGFYVFIDLSKYLDEPTFEAERRLHQRLLDAKVTLSAGETTFVSTPGWFRIVFTSVDLDTLREGVRRITEAITKHQTR